MPQVQSLYYEQNKDTPRKQPDKLQDEQDEIAFFFETGSQVFQACQSQRACAE